MERVDPFPPPNRICRNCGSKAHYTFFCSESHHSVEFQFHSNSESSPFNSSRMSPKEEKLLQDRRQKKSSSPKPKSNRDSFALRNSTKVPLNQTSATSCDSQTLRRSEVIATIPKDSEGTQEECEPQIVGTPDINIVAHLEEQAPSIHNKSSQDKSQEQSDPTNSTNRPEREDM